MPASGSSIYADADGYQAGLRDMFDLLVPHPAEFHARLTWIEFPGLRLLRGQESTSRVAFMTLPADLSFITFASQQGSNLVYNGAPLQYGDICFHSRGEHVYQRTLAATHWASVALLPTSLLRFGRTLAGRDFIAPGESQLLRPRRADLRRLQGLHAKAGRIVETHLDRIANPEVARALEQELACALIHCLAHGRPPDSDPGAHERANIAVRLAALLTANPRRLLRMREAGIELGLSEQKLGATCQAILGMSLAHYQRLRRLNLVRIELQRAGLTTRAIVELVTGYGFRGLDHFVTDTDRAWRNAAAASSQCPVTMTLRRHFSDCA